MTLKPIITDKNVDTPTVTPTHAARIYLPQPVRKHFLLLPCSNETNYSKCGKYDSIINLKYKQKAQSSKMTHYMQGATDDKDTKKKLTTKT